MPLKSPDLITRLKAEEHDEDLQALLDEINRDLRASRNHMGKSYETWDRNIDTYRSVRVDDPDDRRARQKKEPVKQTVPLSYAQVTTFVTYITLLYTQNPKVFELGATGDEDYVMREVSEKVLAREVRTNRFLSVLTEFLLNVARMNLGVLKTSWVEERFTPPAEEVMIFEGSGEALDVESEEVLVKEGSEVFNVSPYNFLPDTRLPLTRWREGQFAADETSYHIGELKEWERAGEVYGTEYLTPMNKKAWKVRGTTRLNEVDPFLQKKGSEDDFMVCVTEVQKWVTPKDYGLSNSESRELWVFKVGNDQRILCAEPMRDANMGFTYDVGQLCPDQHGELSDSLSTLIEELQEVVSWLFNSRIAAVRKNIESQLVVHQNFIELSDLESRSPFIRTKKSAPIGLGVDKFISQLRTTDPTATHFQDVETVMGLMEKVSGVNGNAMGSFHSGRRSAAEAKNVASGAAARMKLVAATIWESAINPCGKRLLINARQWMSAETFFRVVGENEEMLAYYETFHRDAWWELIGSEDFFVYDGTSQNEKGFIAQSLQELAIALISNPQLAVQMGLSIPDMVAEIQRLRGVDNLNRFKLAPDEQARQLQQFALLQGGQPQLTAGGGGNAGTGGVA